MAENERPREERFAPGEDAEKAFAALREGAVKPVALGIIVGEAGPTALFSAPDLVAPGPDTGPLDLDYAWNLAYGVTAEGPHGIAVLDLNWEEVGMVAKVEFDLDDAWTVRALTAVGTWRRIAFTKMSEEEVTATGPGDGSMDQELSDVVYFSFHNEDETLDQVVSCGAAMQMFKLVQPVLDEVIEEVAKQEEEALANFQGPIN